METGRATNSRATGGLYALAVVALFGLVLLWVLVDGPFERGDGARGLGTQAPLPGRTVVAKPPSIEGVSEVDRSVSSSTLSVQADSMAAPRRTASSANKLEDAGQASLSHVIYIEGSVHDARAKEPLTDVLVRLESSAGQASLRALEAEGRTDADGGFRMRWSADVPADLSLLGEGFVPARRPDVPLTEFLELQLDAVARIHGQVLGATAALIAATPEAPPKALAWYASTSSKRLWEKHEAELSPQGEFSFEDLVGGDYVLSASIRGRVVPFVSGIHVASGEDQRVQLEALETATVEGRVLRQPVAKGGLQEGVGGAVLTLAPVLKGLPTEALALRTAETVSDSQGRYSLEGFAPGSYRLTVNLPWSERIGRTVDVATSGETVEYDVFCRSPARLAGRLIDADGKPVRSAFVALFIEKDRRRRAQMTDWTFDDAVPQVRSDASGNFSFDACPTKTPLTLAIRRMNAGDGGTRAPANLRVQALKPGEERLGRDFVLPPDTWLAGRVLGPTGQPISDAKVELYKRQGKLGTRVAKSQSDDAGRFRMEGLPSGAATIFATAPDLLSATQKVEIQDTGTEVDVILFESFEVEGVAVDQQGIAIANVPIRLLFDPEADVSPENSKRRRKRVAVSDEFGRFRFEALFDGDWTVDGGSFEWELMGADPGLLHPSLNAWTTLTFAARDRDERFTISGRVEGSDGLPPAGIRIEGLRGGLLELNRGQFVATGLTPTTHRLTFYGDGHRRATVGPITPIPGGEVDLGLISLELACRVTVRLTDTKGKLIDKPTIFLAPLALDKGGPKDQRRVSFGHQSKNRYFTNQAARAQYRLVIKAEGFDTFREVLDLSQRASLSKRVRLKRSSTD